MRWPLTVRYCEHCGRRMRFALRGTHECPSCALQRERYAHYYEFYFEPLRTKNGRLIRFRQQSGKKVGEP